MQQLKVEQQNEQVKRECKGRALALTRNVYRLVNSDVYYVQSERSDNIYYYCKIKFDTLEYCSCPDNSMRSMKCKHLHAVMYAIRLGILKDVDKLPEQVKKEVTKSYTEDDYSF